MKNILLTLSICTLLLNCTGGTKSESAVEGDFNPNKNDLTKANVKGDVIEIIDTIFTALEKFGELKKSDVKNITVTSFSNGFITESTVYRADREMDNKMICAYRNDTIVSLIQYDSKNKQESKEVYDYSKAECFSENSNYDKNDDLVRIIKTKTDSLGNVVEESTYDKKGQLTSKALSTYLNKHYRTETVSYDENGDLDYKLVIEYDSINNPVSYSFYDESGDKKIKTLQKFNTQKDVVEEIMYSYFYEDSKDEYTYEYKYDSTNNWIEKIRFESQKPKSITSRSIKYKK